LATKSLAELKDKRKNNAVVTHNAKMADAEDTLYYSGQALVMTADLQCRYTTYATARLIQKVDLVLLGVFHFFIEGMPYNPLFL